MRSLTWSQVHAHRLRRSHLTASVPLMDVDRLVREVCGIQAQVMTAAEYAIGARISDGTLPDVQRVVWTERRLIKTYGMRHTLHLLTAEDHPMWAASMLAHPSWDSSRWYQQFGVTAAVGKQLLDAMREALDGRNLTRDELATRVAERVGPWAVAPLQSAWGEMLIPASYHGIVCFGPNVGAKVSFVRRDQWSKAGDWPYPGDALTDILRAYLRAYAPAVPADVARWFALKVPQARYLLDQLADEVVPVTVEGQPALILREDDTSWDDDARSVRLLPQYDAYVLGCGMRDKVVPRPLCDRIFQHGRGRYEGAVAQNVLLVDGVVSGMWSRQFRRGRVQLTVESFVDLSASQRATLNDEAARVARFYDAQPELVYATLTSRR